MKDIKEILKNTTEENQDKVDWTKAWSKKYPILKKYQEEVDISYYVSNIKEMLDDISGRYGYSKQDAMLVLKDILAHVYFENK